MVVLQYPQGVPFGKETAHLVIGIAGKGNDHLSILANIATTMDEFDEQHIQELYETKDKNMIYKLFTDMDE